MDASPSGPRFWNVPNSLTMSRLGLAVVVFGLIEARLYVVAMITFVVASLTDALDGYFARLLNQTSAIGRQLDPLVDKVINCGAFVYLVALPEESTGLAPWMVTAIIVRELVVQALRSLIEGKGVAFGAKWAGKLKTVFQCLSIGVILLALQYPPNGAWLYARDAVTWTAVLLTIYSGMSYLVLAWPSLRGDLSTTQS